jgi:hypothetical protein
MFCVEKDGGVGDEFVCLFFFLLSFFLGKISKIE